MSVGAWKNIGFMVLVLVLVVGIRMWFGRAAPVPNVFEGSPRLAEAIAQSSATGKPVFAIFTADWCPPCQSYKRGSLSESRVASALRDRAIPVYVNVDRDTEDLATLERLGMGVRSLPTTVVLAGGEIRTHAVGAQGAGDVLAMLALGERAR